MQFQDNRMVNTHISILKQDSVHTPPKIQCNVQKMLLLLVLLDWVFFYFYCFMKRKHEREKILVSGNLPLSNSLSSFFHRQHRQAPTLQWNCHVKCSRNWRGWEKGSARKKRGQHETKKSSCPEMKGEKNKRYSFIVNLSSPQSSPEIPK